MTKNKTKIIMITVITAILMAASSIVIYSNVSKPKFYEYFMDMGNKYLSESKYEESILAFNKAIKIEPKSTEARVEISKAYIGNNQPDKAIDSLKEAQSIDTENSVLLIEILDILKDIDGDIAYEVLQNYIDKIGKDNIPNHIKDILETINELPKEPIVNVEPGKYIKPIYIKLQLDKIKVGHSFYYTTDGTDPNKESQKYRGIIEITKDTNLKIIGYNNKGESTEVILLEYIIDTNMEHELKNLIKESKKLIDTTEVGTNIGNVVEGSKEEFVKAIKKVNKELEEPIISYDKALIIQSELNQAMDEFKNNIIEDTDKDELKNTISKSQQIYDNAVEGNKEGQFNPGSKEILLNAIKEAQRTHDNILSKQKDIDDEVNSLSKAILSFERSKIMPFPKDLASKYINKLRAIEDEQESIYNNRDLSNGEMGDRLSMISDKYNTVLSEIYIDLDKYLSPSKKENLNQSKQSFEQEKANEIRELDELAAWSPGTWVNTGYPETIAEVTKEHCYKLIQEYMK